MKRQAWLKVALLSGACAISLANTARADDFDIPPGDLKTALGVYMAETGVQLMVSENALKGARTSGVKGTLSRDEALIRLLKGTGFSLRHDESGAVGIVRNPQASSLESDDLPAIVQVAQAAPASHAAVETVTVTSSKLGGADVQSVPIAITALSQEQLTATQTAGGPDLVKQVPNLTFTKTNFSGYSIEIRGIGTQAISVTTDPAVAVALNDTPFIRNHFFEQEFYDLGQAEVLRGPQGTLYGRNATAGVVNLVTAKPTDQFEAMASADVGNYQNRRFEGMVNIPLVDDRVDIRVAGEWTKREGYTFDEETDQQIDGRDLWSGRMTVGFKPVEKLQTYLVWEHFSEDDDRLRSGKQLCKTDPGPTQVNGIPVPPGTNPGPFIGTDRSNVFDVSDAILSQGCLPTSLYSPSAFETPFGPSLPYVEGGEVAGVVANLNPYVGTTQSPNLRTIASVLSPHYKAKNDTVEFNADYQVTPALTLTSQSGYNRDFLFSLEDFNRFNTAPGFFGPNGYNQPQGEGPAKLNPATGTYFFCDPQLGCSDRLVGEDLSDENAWQLSQEFRLASNFSGPLNFSVGGNYLHYETEENYYVFFNTLTALAEEATGQFTLPSPPPPGDSDNHECLKNGFTFNDPSLGGGLPTIGSCVYIDTNPIGSLNNNGHNYFLSENPYTLNSYAGFGEVYYQLFEDFKLTGGLRWTDDRKHFVQIPSWVDAGGWGYPIAGVVNQQWDQWTGRAVANWTPKLDFTDQTLVYGSYAHGYKAGGANPPGAILDNSGSILGTGAVDINFPTHPLTFKPEFIEAFEFGTKNTLLDGALTFNGDVFYYNYKGYQISEIVDRSAVNFNFNAHIKGAELETTWEPLPGLRFNFAGGYEDTTIGKGQEAIDLMDRTAGTPGWLVVKPFVTQASNCVLPDYVVAAMIQQNGQGFEGGYCEAAYNGHVDPVSGEPYVLDPTVQHAGVGNIPPGYPGFDPVSPDAINDGAGPAPNNGEGFTKNLGGNKLPNAPPFTVSGGAQYTMPITTEWAGTLRGDYYWQDYSWARVFNDNPYDRLRGYTNVNLALIFTNQNGWQAMAYVKNIFDTTDITGTFLNSDDTGLTTNVFLTDPRLFGIRVTKNW